ncbi:MULTISPECIES: MBL fold metallo-hydrolase [Fusobacterium]|uniref:MBL fold metallo-hydrolase n=1 Tax=Fusobacterium TaxID=848 RepID=UPI001477021A|nr:MULTISPECIES: MBL fold metallo-hydrolase [Fusobacterium]NME35680.1 MBL fold metallo-hydrolase [Fusobacterium sp. FSA-380-WT-3A]
MKKENYYKISNPFKNIYRIYEPGDIFSTLIIGEEKALLIDTGHGFENLKEVVKKITSLPLMVLNTHGHLDHTGGNYLFDEIYINPKDIPLYYKYEKEKKMMIETYKELYKERNLVMWADDFNEEKFLKTTTKAFIPLENNQIIDLGNRKLEVIEVPGHTLGHVVILDYETGIVFSGDAVSTSIWIYYNNGISPEEYIENLEVLKKYPIKGFLSAHVENLLPQSLITELQNLIRERDPEKSKVFTHRRNGEKALIFRKDVETLGRLYLLYSIKEKYKV